MTKRIVSIDFRFPREAVKTLRMSEIKSLLEYDIIVHQADFYDILGAEVFHDISIPFTLDSSRALRLSDTLRKWLYEYQLALSHGNTVFVFLNVLSQRKCFYIDPHSNAKKSFSQFEHVFPLQYERIVPSHGTEIVRVPHEKAFSSYWHEFSTDSFFNGYFDCELSRPIFRTKSGNFAVGAVFEVEKGHLVVLPPVNDAHRIEGKDKAEWETTKIAFGKTLASELIKIDSMLRGEKSKTACPAWVSDLAYTSGEASAIKAEIFKLDTKIEEIEQEKTINLQRLEHVESLKNLLFETGDFLNEIVLEALKVMGFTDVESYDNGVLELDVMAVAPEGIRILGEVEGKDKSAIDNHKMDQLERNVRDEFSHFQRTEYSKAVLFGNGFRLAEVSGRSTQFTLHCVKGAERSKAALVQTADLYFPTLYIRESNDVDFARKCREAILRSEGRIAEFPKIPHKS